MKVVKALIVIFLLLLPVIIFGNSKYVELNNLAIIRGIGVSCNEDINLYFQEIIPTKGDNGIEYQYEYYQGDGKNINAAFNKIQLKTKKKLYLSKVKFLVTNCTKSEPILKSLKLHDLKIYHVQNGVFKQLQNIKQ